MFSRLCAVLENAMRLSLIATSLLVLSSCQAPVTHQDATAGKMRKELSDPDSGFCRDAAWYFANRTGPQATPLRERLAPYGFMSLEDTREIPTSETALSPYLLDTEPIIHLLADKIGLRRHIGGLTVSAWAEGRKLLEQQIAEHRIACASGKLTIEMPGDWRYSFGSPGHARLRLELALDSDGGLALHAIYRSWTALFFVMPVKATSDREMHFAALAVPEDRPAPGSNQSKQETACKPLTGRYDPAGRALTSPGNRNQTELIAVHFSELLPFREVTDASEDPANRSYLDISHQESVGVNLMIQSGSSGPREAHVAASRIRCRDQAWEFRLDAGFDPAATFWLAGVAYERTLLRLWHDAYGGLMAEVREVVNGTVMVVLPINSRQSVWLRFPGVEDET